MKQYDILQKVEIIDTSSEGKGVGKVNDFVVFVEHTIPGDIVDVQIIRKKKNFCEGKSVHYHVLSEKRAEPLCQHFAVCGGCKWQNMKYEHQLFYKQKQIEDAITRIGHLDFSPLKKESMFLPIIPSKNIYEYRNKLEFTFSNKRWLTTEEITSGKKYETSDNFALGFHLPNRFDKILDIKKCHLQKDLSNEIRLEIKRYALENELSFFDLKNQNGFLRNLIIRNTIIGQWMVIVGFYYEDNLSQEKLLVHLAKKIPQITSLQYVINPKKNSTISDLDVKVFSGTNSIYEEMENLKFRVSPKSFFQTNSFQAYELYKVVRDFAELKGNDIVYDLYTGTGTIANFIARKTKKVIGIEYISEAIEDAKINSLMNKITNTEFFARDIKDVLNENFVKQNGKPSIIITDPPRTGMHPDVVKRILEIYPERIVYVNCNPSTMARDILLMSEKYFVVKIQPVDMFPHTTHVESIVQMRRK
ncbi:MAG: 23S rRNA (uracil(1939)-C(5))-methyltransferase RlmD [Bacteroidota bacterium]